MENTVKIIESYYDGVPPELFVMTLDELDRALIKALAVKIAR